MEKNRRKRLYLVLAAVAVTWILLFLKDGALRQLYVSPEIIQSDYLYQQNESLSHPHQGASRSRRCRSTSCNSTNPEAIITWSGLITSLHPPVKANCQQLNAGNFAEQRRVRSALEHWTNAMSDETFYEIITNCSNVRKLFSPNNFYISQTEKDFPLAYAILFYESPQQIVRLLKVIYRPQNIFCLHPDGKASQQLIQGFRQMALCLDNVFVPKELVKVTYKHFSTVEAQMLCFEQLSTTYGHWQWKYAINLCGKEVVLYSNRVIVDTLERLKGSSVLSIEDLPSDVIRARLGSHFNRTTDGEMYYVGPRKEPIPFGVKLYKSSNFISASRQFVEFLLRDKKVQTLRQYMSTGIYVDELFFPTAYMLPEAPKGYGTGVRAGQGKGVGGVVTSISFWSSESQRCTGRVVHEICILNVLDLPTLFQTATINFFFNKYFMEYDHVVMDCLERRIVEQNQLEYMRDCLDVCS